MEREKWKIFFCMVSEQVKASRKKVIKSIIIHFIIIMGGKFQRRARRAARTKNETFDTIHQTWHFLLAFRLNSRLCFVCKQQ
jgi:hypothetical protein